MSETPKTVTEELTAAMGAISAVASAAGGNASVACPAEFAVSAIQRALNLIQHLRCEAVAQLDKL